MYAEDVVAAEYRRLGWFRRMVLRWVSNDMHHAARHLSKHRRPIVQVPHLGKTGPVTELADRWFAGHR